MARFFIPLLLLLSTILLLLVQCTCTWRWPIWGVRLELLPALLLYAAFTLNLSAALIVALVAAIMYDSFSGGHFGASMLPYVLSTALFCGVRPIFFRNSIITRFLAGLALGFIALFLQWAFAGKFAIGLEHVLPRLGHLAVLTGFLAIIYFTGLDLFCRLVGVDPGRFEEERP